MTQPSDQPILVLSRKKPHLILLLILSVLSGLAYFLDGPVEPKIPQWLAQAWAVVLLFSGGLALVAHLQRWDRERGMHVERGALTLQAAAVTGYGLALPAYLGWQAQTAVSLLAAATWAGTNLWEVRLIGEDLKLISAVRRLTPRSGNASD